MRHLAVAVSLVMLLSAQAYAEFYKWTDSSGTEHFTDDTSRIPLKYRKKATPLSGYDSDPPAAQPTEKAGKGAPEASAGRNNAADGSLSGEGDSTTRAEGSAKDKARHSPRNDGSRSSTLANMLLKEGMSERDKAYAVFVWIRTNIAYDNSTKWKRRYGDAGADQSPDAVLASGRAVCEGIARLFSDVAERMGLESVVISGRASGARQERHAWNAVKIDGQWGLVDITRHTFLATPQEFLARHFPDDPQWQLLDKPLTYEEWLKR